MKYRDLLNALLELDEEELELTATIFMSDSEECHPVNYTDKYGGDGVVEENHPIIVV
jgi:hypothetical protein